MSDPSDPYADLRRTLPTMLVPMPKLGVVQSGHTAATGRHHDGPGVECPNPWCAYTEAANPDTIARLLAERDALAAGSARPSRRERSA